MIRTTVALFLLSLVFLLVSCGSSNEAKQADQVTAKPEARQIQPYPEPETKQPAKVQSKQSAAEQAPIKAAVDSKPNLVQFAAFDIDGNLHNSDEWIGKQPTVVNVWGTWCPPCRREIPELVRLNQEYSEKGVALLGLAVRDTPAKVEMFAAKNKMTWLMLMGESKHLYSLGVITGVPTTIFYNREGKEVQRFVGPRSYDVFKGAFEAIL